MFYRLEAPARRGAAAALCATFVFVAASAAPLLAQATATSPPGDIAPSERPSPLAFSGTVDVMSAYMFRGIRQDDRGLIVWPGAEAGAALLRSDTGLQEVRLNVGLWNSLHSGPTGIDGPSAKMWYESDFYTGVTAAFRGGFSAGATYTAYMSPNDSFTTIREIALTSAFDDSGSGFPVSPYALIAFELDGQADGGSAKGTYLEMGVKPTRSVIPARLTLTFPVKVGLSLSDYYETSAGSGTFGYFDAGALATVPLPFIPEGYGTWAVRGGLNVLTLGDALKVLNDGKARKVVASLGISFSQ